MSRRFQPLTSAPMQAALRKIAERHGYTATRGPHANQGSPSELVQALDAGELATVLLDSDERWSVISWLESQAAAMDNPGYGLPETIRSLAAQLRVAADIERQLEAEEAAYFLPPHQRICYDCPPPTLATTSHDLAVSEATPNAGSATPNDPARLPAAYSDASGPSQEHN